MTFQALHTKPKHTTFTERQRRIFTFLDTEHAGVLCTITPEGEPHGSVVYYAIDEHFVVHILTKKGTRKHANILHNNHVMFTVWEAKTQTTAQIIGRAREQASGDAVTKIANILFSRLGPEATSLLPIMKLQAGAFTTIDIEPLQIRMAVYSHPGTGDYHELFESIESFDLRDN
ncbi:MAG TPA: pyridoxamine 5'-phosphate oxidase family protein [Candidatus Saccharimonadales bacterium]|nr:pyridoxamine 5'-phosphate oxidase family protein [Candidatus Saccharimonadales bacterium]